MNDRGPAVIAAALLTATTATAAVAEQAPQPDSVLEMESMGRNPSTMSLCVFFTRGDVALSYADTLSGYGRSEQSGGGNR
ncbi:hypothetical protein SAMN05444920_107445 [Nonomuraea solani]|uniref:Uncharacterized protein n=1 Tax=Nonomuraea solani TaxID=1144553 RepID=A0A1H6E377_9ACTN|nr:hypothetical protein [Nonomuraea solani]SEG92082.1 hypothetical protein SAMN05444920_107445 [Nonomuraea solani]